MKSGRLVPVLLVLTLVAAGSLASPARAEGPKVVEAELETPFALVVGETGRVEPEGLEITLRSISDDSGCLAPNDCSVMMFKGTLALRLEEQRELSEVDFGFKADAPASLTFAGYKIEVLAVRRATAKGPLPVTFRVVKAPEKEPEEDEPDR